MMVLPTAGWPSHLGKTPELLTSIKNRLYENRKTKPLFRTGLFVRHLEQAYTMMWQSYLMGEKPDNITVSDSFLPVQGFK